MTVQELRDLLTEYPSDATVEIMGFTQGRYGDWTAYHSTDIEMDYEDIMKTLYIEGIVEL